MCHRKLRSRKAWFCSDACRMRAYRRRKAGVPEDFGLARLPSGSTSLAKSWELVRRQNILDSVPPPFS
jgi:hypothetical protein